MRTLEQVAAEITSRSECCTETIKDAVSSNQLAIPLTSDEIETILRNEERKSFRYCIPIIDICKALLAKQKEIR
jgi:DNA helicase TIP49 (TBP-interacting protein)